MPRALTDQHADRPRSRLPESVDRLLGVPSADPEPELTVEALEQITKELDAAPLDSNIDRLPWNNGDIDVLFDGTEATRALVVAIHRRMKNPVEKNEQVRITSTR